MQLTLTQCRQIAQNADLRDTVEALKDQPDWLVAMDDDLTIYDVKSIQQGGCASGAFMPAVTYYTAKQIMAEHGDDILDYIGDIYAEPVAIEQDESWGSFNCRVVSMAVEMWCSNFDLDGVDY